MVGYGAYRLTTLRPGDLASAHSRHAPRLAAHIELCPQTSIDPRQDQLQGRKKQPGSTLRERAEGLYSTRANPLN